MKGAISIGHGSLFLGDCMDYLKAYQGENFQAIITDPPYFRVLDNDWDHFWKTEQDYLDWCRGWVRLCMNFLASDGLLFIFGQHGKREQAFIHLCSLLSRDFHFHDLIVWDRVVGYNDRSDSFTPQYENILVLRKDKNAKPYFDKDAVRIAYDEATIKMYLKDKRYKDRESREKNLRKGKYATNILSVPSLKGSSKEKIGHPSQKPIALIEMLIKASSRKGDTIFDPFMGSGTTALACENLGRKWIGCESSEEYAKMTQTRLNESIGLFR
jgi:site-specific DNA-methyltransferase (adenine-specific)